MQAAISPQNTHKYSQTIMQRAALGNGQTSTTYTAGLAVVTFGQHQLNSGGTPSLTILVSTKQCLGDLSTPPSVYQPRDSRGDERSPTGV